MEAGSRHMSASVLYMSMSLDGFIAGPNDGTDNPGGDGGAVERLHQWGYTVDGDVRRSGPAGEIAAAMEATSAVVAGRRTVEQVDHWGGDHHGMPIFVPSHRPPGPSVVNHPLVTYVTDGIAQRDGPGKGCGRGPERDGARRVHGTAGPRGRGPRRVADPPDPGPRTSATADDVSVLRSEADAKDERRADQMWLRGVSTRSSQPAETCETVARPFRPAGRRRCCSSRPAGRPDRLRRR